MHHLLTAEMFGLERAELVRRLRRNPHAAIVPAARTSSRRRSAR
ncbi:hypothetical protein GA0074695_3074 [Micromonospora viridifaciens]|uniref:Uncharacterized protein n=1 Tax=Micromonospora viridifaciens TaxID=1881 RepID=A0A1C4X7A0_MICVI|nr:hypothetical protein [Micromonospora viridifaciens]SCF04373.1 hypothetical protein GA0074695_3074 [Micromonospora viridifaciens]